MILVPTKGVGDLAERLFVRIPRLRAVNRLRNIEDQMTFAAKHGLVLPEEQAELAEMLASGARPSDAFSELRARRRVS
jgi:hypothetical protein